MSAAWPLFIRLRNSPRARDTAASCQLRASFRTTIVENGCSVNDLMQQTHTHTGIGVRRGLGAQTQPHRHSNERMNRGFAVAAEVSGRPNVMGSTALPAAGARSIAQLNRESDLCMVALAKAEATNVTPFSRFDIAA